MEIKEFFIKLDKAGKKEEIEELFNKLNIERKYQKNKDEYPSLEFNITKDEIEILKKEKFITTDNNLNVSLSKKSDLSTLEKLLFAVVWKNGDLPKIKHIISGIYGEESTGKVFNQFGKHLCNNEELIIDQHVLRAYIYKGKDKIIEKIDDKVFDEYSNEYKEWINNNPLFKENKDLMDDILFAIGKKIKPEKKSKGKK
jgi:hypothetical protein